MHERAILALLKGVSRSFYLTVRVLPSRVREPVALAYLLARAADTIADTDGLPVDRRIASLEALRERFASFHTRPLALDDFTQSQASPAERLLLTRLEVLIELLETSVPDDRDLIRNVLDTITSGQELDLVRFRDASAERVVALQTPAELDDYTYRVAGCVGEFWTKLGRLHLFPRDWMDFKAQLAKGVRFGKGLQLVNILRDLPRDLRQGRCYIPAQSLARHTLRPEELLDPANGARFRALYTEHLNLADDHLAAGWVYTNALPFRLLRLRLACAWPLLIGARTLSLLRVSNVLDPTQRVKVSRPEVRSLMLRSTLLYPLPPVWRGLFDAARRASAA